MKSSRYSAFHGRSSSSYLDVLDLHAERMPDKLAVILLHGAAWQLTRLDYAELRRSVVRVGVALSRLPTSGRCVLLLMPQSIEFLVTLLGCMSAGLVPIPLSYGTRARDRQRLANVLRDSGADLIVTLDESLSAVQAASAGLPGVRIESISASLRDTGGPDHVRRSGLAELALLQYTSGSTGDPKGVMVDHENLLAHAECLQQGFELDAQTVWVSWLPQFHDMGLIGGMLQPLFVGGTSVVMAPETFVRWPARWLRAISDYRANVSGGPNFGYDYCVRRVGDDALAELDLSSWRVAFNGAERVRASTLRAFCDKFGAAGFDPSAVHPCYGLAESTLFVTGGTEAHLGRRRAQVAAMTGAPARGTKPSEAVSLGVCFGDSRFEIVDPATCSPQPEGTIGEVWVAGPTVAKGYWGRSGESEAQFTARLNGGPRESVYLRTGDLGLQIGGELFFAGRLKEVFVHQGVNYHPEDIEEQLRQTSELFRSGNTLAFAIAGEREEELVVVQEAVNESGCPEEPALRAAVMRAVTELGIPIAEVGYIAKNQIPKTTSGKVERRRCSVLYTGGQIKILRRYDLREAYAPLEPTQAAGAAARGRAPALDDVFGQLHEALSGALPYLDIDDQIANCGLDSISMVGLRARLSSALGAELSHLEPLPGETFRSLIERAVVFAGCEAAQEQPSPNGLALTIL